MNWTRRLRAATGKRVAAVAGVCALFVLNGTPAQAAAVPNAYAAVYHGKHFTLTHVVWKRGARAIGVEDPAFAWLLHALGATMTWRPGQRDVFITTAQPAVIAFTIGNRSYEAGRAGSQAAFAPFTRGGEAYLPLNEVLGALSLLPVDERKGTLHLLEPQITALDVENASGVTTVAAFAGMRLHPGAIRRTASQITYEFDGVGSTLARASTIGGGIRSVWVRTRGRPPAQRTFVVVSLASATAAPAVSALRGAQVTGVDVMPSASDFTVAIDVNGDATYAWHRLRAPDSRFWVDVRGAHLAVPPRQDIWTGGHVDGVRVTQFTPTSVRVALTLAGEQTIDVVPSANGLRIVVGNAIVANEPAAGSGSIGQTVVASVESAPASAVVSAAVAPSSTPAGGENVDQQDLVSPPGWKFGPPQPYVPRNPRLIVIDPGHGGADPGTVYRGVSEKNITLDTALRLRDILVAAGWQVLMTRTTDHDVDGTARSSRESAAMGYANPDASDLQARDDIANSAGARLFISIHVNACCGTPDPTPSGTTSYYSKPEDVALAQDVERAITTALGTHDDGIVKSRLYVTLHASMPAVLVETAFITNPTDYAHLTSPRWRERLAHAIASGIETYTRENPVPEGTASANQ